MGFLSVFLIAISLAVDAFAVSVTNGIAIKDFKAKNAVKTAFYFGAFQFVMPILGFMLGSGFEGLIKTFDHWVAFGLLAVIGLNMISESFKEECAEAVENTAENYLTVPRLITQAIATSIDALAVGISFAVAGTENILLNSLIIGVVAFVFSYIGGIFGKKIGGAFKNYAGRIGGIILICIGIKIVLEHLGII